MGFYRGLGPTLAKVVPAVSISYVVYDHVRMVVLYIFFANALQAKKGLGVA